MGFCAASVGFRKEEAFEKKLFFILNMRFSAAGFNRGMLCVPLENRILIFCA